MLRKYCIIYRDILGLTSAAVLIGFLTGLVSAPFGYVLLLITDFRMNHAYYLIPFLGVIGAVIVWCYNKFGGASVKGMLLVFEAGHGINDNIPFRLIPFSIAVTWLTHLFGGSAGREGVAIQIGGTIALGIGGREKIQNHKKILLIAGIAAGYAGLFRLPIVATFLALEMLTAGVLEQEALLPTLTASYTASYTSYLLGLEKFTFALTDEIIFSWVLVFKLIVIGIAFGVTGGLFSVSLQKTREILPKWLKNPILRIFIVGAAISGLSLLCWGGRYSGLGTNLIDMSFDNGIYSWDFAFKFLFTVITLSAGFQGGEATPLCSIGASLGIVLASLFSLPAAFVAALGYAAVFGGATNTLIAPMMLGAEVFGFGYLPYFFIVCAIAYVFNGNMSIYPLQKKK
jgi:H+/Cl- antiporter ClcA